MGSSPFGFRTAIMALFVGFTALQVITTVRKSLRLTVFLGNETPISDSEEMLPIRAPWRRQEINRTAGIQDPPTDDDPRNDEDVDDGKDRNAKFDDVTQTQTSSPTSATTATASQSPTSATTANEHSNNNVGDIAKERARKLPTTSRKATDDKSKNTLSKLTTTSKKATNNKSKNTLGKDSANKPQWQKMWTTIWMDNCPHFFSHIPKSGTEYAHQELIHLFQSTVRLPGNRSIYSVREAQKRFDANVYEGEFLKSQPQYEHQNFPIPVDTTGETDGYTPPFICNQGTTEFRHLKPYHVARHTRYRCDLFVTEQHWNPAAHNVYTIVREPFSHVLSQYFHCVESKDHARNKGNRPKVANRQDLMPPLDEWLKIYANLTEANYTPKQLYDKSKMLKRRFSCYTPIESESEFTKFDHNLPKDYTYPYPYTNDHGDRDEKTKQLDKILFDDLKQKYRVIGDTSQMVKSVCAIFITYMDGKHIPETCDCTNPRVSDSDSSSNSSQFYVHDLYKDPQIERDDYLNFKIKMGYNPIHHSHGVKHHGSSFLNELTQDQRDLIAKLRSKDQVLYNVSRAVFDEQIQEMEASYGIKVCDQWNRPKQRLFQ